MLTLALFLSGLLGLVQDWTYSLYGRPTTDIQHKPQNTHDKNDPPAWQESMFYLHFLALPMFLSVRHDLASQFRSLNAGPFFHIPIPPWTTKKPYSPRNIYLSFPRAYVPLILNTLTQLLCVSGVHRLTTRVSALTVTLVLVVRKAASFVISVLWLRGLGHSTNADMSTEGWLTMWFGAGLVLAGTVGYSVGSGRKSIETREPKDTKIE
jgi:UDP-xylose/UDP-N-acetylglucosamine transporter B4